MARRPVSAFRARVIILVTENQLLLILFLISNIAAPKTKFPPL